MPTPQPLNLDPAELEAFVGVLKQGVDASISVTISTPTLQPGDTARLVLKTDLNGAAVDTLSSEGSNPRITRTGQVFALSFPGAVTGSYPGIEYKKIGVQDDWPAAWGSAVVGFLLYGTFICTGADGVDRFAFDLGLLWEAFYK